MALYRLSTSTRVVLALAASLAPISCSPDNGSRLDPAAVSNTCRLARCQIPDPKGLLTITPRDVETRLQHLFLAGAGSDTHEHVLLAKVGQSMARTAAEPRNPAEQRCEPVRVFRSDGLVRVYAGDALVEERPVPNGPLELIWGWERSPDAAGCDVRYQKLGPPLLADDFMRERVGRGDAWRIESGRWWIRQAAEYGAAPNAFMLEADASDQAALLTTGEPFWVDYRMQCSVRMGRGGEAGLVFGISEPKRSCAAILRADEPGRSVRASMVQNGQKRELASRRVFLVPGRWYHVAVEVCEGRPARISLDGERLLEVDVPGPAFGRVGLTARGTAAFDDFEVSGLAASPDKHALRRVLQYSKTFKDKPPFPEDDRDKKLHRWASDTDAWEQHELRWKNGLHRGWISTALLFGDLAVVPQEDPGAKLLALLSVDGEPVCVQPLNGRVRLARRGESLQLDGREVGRVPSSRGVRVGVYSDHAPESLSPPKVLSRTFVQEFFEMAPARWVPVSGTWDLTSRWQCKPKWNFFGGVGTADVVLFSKDRFDGNQRHEFYYGMKDVFGRAFENRRYARHDVNFSFCTNGRDLSSGYSVLFGAYQNRSTLLLKGDLIVAQNNHVKFEDFVDIDDLHLYWRRFRIERMGRRIRVFLDRQTVFDWTDPSDKIPDGGHIALWTHRNGILYARVNSSAEAVANGSARYFSVLGRGAANGWKSLHPSRVRVEDLGDGRVRVRNLFGGGHFAVQREFDAPVALASRPVLRLPFRAGPGARVNLHVVAGGRPMVLKLSAPTTKTHEVLGRNPVSWSDWEVYARRPLESPFVGEHAFLKPGSDVLEVNLVQAAKRRGLSLTGTMLTSLVVGNSSNAGYLLAGFGGNTSKAWYELGAPEFRPSP